MTNTTTDTLTVEQTIRIAASPETLWSFWTDPPRLAEWWGTADTLEAVPGGAYRIVMENGLVMRGEFTELDPPHRLAFTFGWEQNAGGPLAPGSTRVEVTMTPAGDETELVLRHFDMPATHASDHQKGWDYHLRERLAAAVAG